MEQLLGVVKITELIEICARNKVSCIEVRADSVKFEFGHGDVETKISINPPDNEPIISIEEKERMNEQVQEIRRQEAIEHLKLTDPVAYEDLLASGHIEDVQDEQDYRGAE